MDVNNDDKLRLNETGLQKPMFDKLDTDHDSALTVDEIKHLMAYLEEKLNAFETSTNMDSSYTVTLSSGVQSVVEATSQLLVSSPVDISSSSTVISSSSEDISSSPVAVQSTLLKASPSSDLIKELSDALAARLG